MNSFLVRYSFIHSETLSLPLALATFSKFLDLQKVDKSRADEINILLKILCTEKMQHFLNYNTLYIVYMNMKNNLVCD